MNLTRTDFSQPTAPAIIGGDHTQFLELLGQQPLSHQLRIGIDYHDAKLWYGLDVKAKSFFLTSGQLIIAGNALPSGLTVPPGPFPTAPISSEGIRRYLSGETVDGKVLLETLEQFFATYAKFQYDTTPTLLAHWVLGGYVYMAFPTFPYLWLTSAERQCGKTRVLELLSAVSFRSQQMMVNPTAAVLYRILDQIGQVMIIDEFEGSTEDVKIAMITVLNAGFKRGSTVPRCVGTEQRVEQFNCYSPKVFAGLDQLPDTLATRTIPIYMFPKSKRDNIKSFSPILMDAWLQRVRDDLGIWALTNAPQCAEWVVKATELELPSCLDDRAADFMAPIFAISRIAGSDRGKLLQFCDTLAEARNSDTTETDTRKVVAALKNWFPPGVGVARLHSSMAVELFSKVGVYCDEKRAGRILKNLGLTPKQLRIGEVSKKGVEITKAQMEDLAERFPMVV